MKAKPGEWPNTAEAKEEHEAPTICSRQPGNEEYGSFVASSSYINTRKIRANKPGLTAAKTVRRKSKEMIKVIWQPSWYELDQPIKIGMKDEFWLTKNHEDIWIFHSGSDGDEVKKTNGEIVRISHKSLGEINEIDTEGLSYKIHLISGDIIQVEAEETPGEIEWNFSTYKKEFDKDDFKFTVDLIKK